MEKYILSNRDPGGSLGLFEMTQRDLKRGTKRQADGY